MPHTLLARGIDGIVDPMMTVTGDVAAAERRLDRIDALTAAILANPGPSVRLTARPDQADVTMLGERRSRISTSAKTRPIRNRVGSDSLTGCYRTA